MKLKLFYNGKPEDTKILNAETGEPLEDVISIQIDIDAHQANAVIYVRDLQLDIDNIESYMASNNE